MRFSYGRVALFEDFERWKIRCYFGAVLGGSWGGFWEGFGRQKQKKAFKRGSKSKPKKDEKRKANKKENYAKLGGLAAGVMGPGERRIRTRTCLKIQHATPPFRWKGAADP